MILLEKDNKVEWNLDTLEKLVFKLTETGDISSADDVLWLFSKLHDPEFKQRPFFEELVNG